MWWNSPAKFCERRWPVSELESHVEQIVEAAIRRHSKSDPALLGRAILESLWELGYDVTRRPDMIPIVRNPGEGIVSPYMAEQDREAQDLTPAEQFQCLEGEPCNAPIRDTISEITARVKGSK